ncbi:extensin family protein [Rhizobium sp. FKL33]|uniref:extensin-like domain-containing protein n=1 Tax=Rhizobium sp. FKL33 TaxID=2562307 RepID=UPI0010C0403F|nr:extensin family protein [Rhizobium sp. FKL33]
MSRPGAPKAERPLNPSTGPERPETAPPAVRGEPPKDAAQDPSNADAPPIEQEDPAAFTRCSNALTALGAEFEEVARVDDGQGCGIDRPIMVKSLGKGVPLSPAGEMRCETALNLTRWTQDVVSPFLQKAQPGETLASVNQASAYICRNRNSASSGKISEHARGNAVDIAGFTFKSGKTLTIAPREEDSTFDGAFQRAIASAACLYFSTVLDPGSDAAHETHLHLDTLARKGGYRYCW